MPSTKAKRRRFDIQFKCADYEALYKASQAEQIPMTAIVRFAVRKYIKDLKKKASAP